MMRRCACNGWLDVHEGVNSDMCVCVCLHSRVHKYTLFMSAASTSRLRISSVLQPPSADMSFF